MFVILVVVVVMMRSCEGGRVMIREDFSYLQRGPVRGPDHSHCTFIPGDNDGGACINQQSFTARPSNMPLPGDKSHFVFHFGAADN